MFYEVLVLTDLHIPSHDERSLSAVEKLMADYNWKYVLYLGDIMDFDCISSHNKENLRAIAGKTIWHDYEIANEILDRHQKLCPTAKFLYAEGNHEERIQRYIDANPQLEGMIELEVGLKLKKRKIDFISYRSGKTFKIGKARFFHGIYTNQFHAKKTVEAFGDNIFYGHTHDVQSFSKEMHGDNKTLVGQSLGCLCRYDQPYMKGRPSKWQQCVTVFYFQKDGYFNYYPIRIFDHRFVFNNKLYMP